MFFTQLAGNSEKEVVLDQHCLADFPSPAGYSSPLKKGSDPLRGVCCLLDLLLFAGSVVPSKGSDPFFNGLIVALTSGILGVSTRQQEECETPTLTSGIGVYSISPSLREGREERAGRAGRRSTVRSRAISHHPSPSATTSDPAQGRVKCRFPLVVAMCRDQCPVGES